MRSLSVKEIVPECVYQRAQFYDFPAELKKSELERLGIGCVVCLIPKYDRDLCWLQDRYVHIPIPDGRVSEGCSALLLENACRVGKWIDDGVKALVHCRAGRNRSSLFSALLAVRSLGLTGAQSVDYLREKRPRALDNDHFERFLRSLHGYKKGIGYIF